LSINVERQADIDKTLSIIVICDNNTRVLPPLCVDVDCLSPSSRASFVLLAANLHVTRLTAPVCVYVCYLCLIDVNRQQKCHMTDVTRGSRVTWVKGQEFSVSRGSWVISGDPVPAVKILTPLKCRCEAGTRAITIAGHVVILVHVDGWTQSCLLYGTQTVQCTNR